VHAVYMAEMKMHTKFKSGNLNGRDTLKDLHIHEKTILMMIIRNVKGSDETKWNGMAWCGLVSYGSVADSCNYGNELSGSI